MKKIIYSILTFFIIIISSCDLTEEPQASVSASAIFGSESGLKAYTYSFYNMLPDGSSAYQQDAMADYGAVNSINSFIRKGAYSAETSSGWTWTDLRNINYFIVNCTNENVSESVRNNYIGIAKFFRAWFYYNMVVRFGDVPWIDEPLSVDDEALYGARDSRTVIVNNIIEDLDYAHNNITETVGDGTLISKWTATALKSRICLFEGTFEKYHTELSLTDSANTYLKLAADAAEAMMDSSGYALYTDDGTSSSFRTLFISDSPVTTESILSVAFSSTASIFSSANWWWTSSTYGPRWSMTRKFVNTFLNTDGTPFTDNADYSTMAFYDECQNRDARLAQTIRTPGYERDDSYAAPNFASYTYTGYQPIKYCLDATSYDDGAYNTNSIPLIRYAEVLLNYAEAKAELGTMTDADWAETIGALRARAGITSGLTAKPTEVDSYLQTNYFPGITDPIILEVRRERSVELALEGFRFTDLKRWRVGELMAEQWDGMYVPALDTAMDLDNDGTYDVLFYNGTEPSSIPSGCTAINVDGTSTITLSDGDHGNILNFVSTDDRYWYPDGRQYYYPIPSTAITKNPNLVQNSGW
ncbi:MAG: RagB/SusD protein [Bacteroidetes bacterium]|nr:RagB/SusD protein [Bacteroidota bacterium]